MIDIPVEIVIFHGYVKLPEAIGFLKWEVPQNYRIIEGANFG